MPTAGVKVLFIGRDWPVEDYEIRSLQHPTQLFSTIAQFKPDVIVTSEYQPTALSVAAFDLRKRWIHVPADADVGQVVDAIESCYSSNLWGEHQYAASNPLVSVYTPTYNTGDYLRDTYQSLRDQTYKNWEWVVVDDCSTDGTWERLLAMAEEDIRVRPVRVTSQGKIGAMKDLATRLCYGVYLVELDHDDMLVDTALDEVRRAFDSDPEIGMVYTNCACFFGDGSPQEYTGDFWGSRYRTVEYRGQQYREALNPDIYDRFGPAYWQQFGWYLTVGPNHIRAYRRDKLLELGGYNRNLPVADDWDLFARFFLYSKCHHIKKMLYLYRFHDAYTNTTFTRNKSIQDHLEWGRRHYAEAFDELNQRRLREKPLAQRVSVVMLDWDGQEHTEACLRSLRQHYPDLEIILGFSGKPFETDLADKTIDLELNMGFAAGIHRCAVEADREFLLILNNDTVVPDGLLEKLYEELQHPDVGVVGPYASQARPPQGDYPEHDHPGRLELPGIVGLCMMMRRDLYFRVGGFDPRFRSSDDDDLCRRLAIMGYKSVVADAWIDHIGHHDFTNHGLEIDKVVSEGLDVYKEKWPRVTVVALTFNEANTLPDFVQQYRDIGITDFAILDSGSTDGTVQWAEENGIRVEHAEFTNFAEQRNLALEKFAWDGKTDWVIMHDPDERLDARSLQYLWELVRSPDFDMCYFPLFDSSGREWVAKPILFKADRDIHWVYPVHEKLIGSHRQAMIRNGRVTHLLEAHTQQRRAEMDELYNSLGSDTESDSCDGYPTLNYNHRSDDRIRSMFLGPLVTVVIPTYRRRELLMKAVRSALDQDYLALEVVVVGDNCPDWGGISLARISTDRVRWYNLSENHGDGGAVPRNYGIMLAAGDWIAYLDDDNQWTPDHLSTTMEAMRLAGAKVGLASMSVDGHEIIFNQPRRGSIDTSCLVHAKSLVYQYGWWVDRQAGGYWHDWTFVEPWVGNETWAATRKATVLYNKDTSGQKEYLTNLIEQTS